MPTEYRSMSAGARAAVEVIVRTGHAVGYSNAEAHTLAQEISAASGQLVVADDWELGC